MWALKIISSTKINLKWTEDINIRAKNVKLLDENIEVNLHDFRFGSGFLDMTTKAWAITTTKN